MTLRACVMAVNFALKCTDVFVGYLGTLNLGLNVRPGYSASEISRPEIVVKTQPAERIRAVEAVNLEVTLLSTSERSIEEDAAIIAAIEAAAADVPAFDAYVASLPAEKRTGWRIFKVIIQDGEVNENAESCTRDCVAMIRVSGRAA